MIDLSHLTDEEQEVILTVLKRDEELKKAEEDRIRMLQKNVSPMESKLKYLTGEWFYEAKSQRHNDKIHGSEIILASMKQRRAATLEGSLSRSRAVSEREADIVAPPKPARLLETPMQPQQIREGYSVPDTERLRSDVNIRSPGMPRHNPFNRASIILEVSEKTDTELANGNQEPVKPSEAAPVSPLKTHCLSSQTSTDSDSSSVSFRPVPKKRTFMSRRPSVLSGNDISLSGPPQGGSGVMTPQGSLQQGSTCSSSLGGGTISSISESQTNCSSHTGNAPVLVSYKQMTAMALVSVEPSLEQAAKPQSNTSQRVVETSQDASFRMSQERSPSPASRGEKLLPSLTDPQTPTNLQPVLLLDSDRNSERFNLRGQKTDSRDGLTQREYNVGPLSDMETSVSSEHQSALLSNITKPAPMEEETYTCNAGTHVDLDRPYDLHVSNDKHERQSTKKPSSKTVFKSAPRSPKTTGEEGDAIAKVLDWFSRSTDSNDWLETGVGSQPEVISTDQEEDMIIGDIIEPVRNYRENISETKYQLREKTVPRMMTDHNQEYDDVNEEDGLKSKSTEVHSPVEVNRTYQFKRRISETETAGRRERQKEEELQKVTQQVRPQDTQAKEEVEDENQSANISQLKSFWEKGNVGPKILISKSNPGAEIKARPGVQKKNDKEEKAVLDKADPLQQSSVSPQSSVSLHMPNQPSPQNESTAEKVRQLKSFWEKEKTRPMFDKSKELGDDRQIRASSKMNKRFTKSEYDLLSIGNESESADERDSVPLSDINNFTILTMNQRLDNTFSPSLGGNRSQFKNLRDFWADATSNRKGPSAFDKPRSLNKNETSDSLHPTLELKQCVDPELYSTTSHTHTEKVSTRPLVDESRHSQSSPSLSRGNKERDHQFRSPTDGQIGSGTGALIDSQFNLSSPSALFSEQQKSPRPQQGRRSSDQKSSKEENPPRQQGTLRKESHSPKTRKDIFGNSSRRSTMRRARSMFSLDVDDQQELDMPYPGQLPKPSKASPIQGKKTQTSRQSADKVGGPRRSSRSSEDSESVSLRARSVIPQDYRHYLGISEKSSVHSSMVPTLKDIDSSAGVDLDLSGPVRTSTPTGSKESYGRRGNKTAQCPPWSNQGSTDTGRESSLSSTSETCSNSRSSPKRENGEEDQSPVKRALRRAEARPKNLAKCLEDITAALPQRQEGRQDPFADPRRGSDASSFASPSSSSFSDPEHLKKLSKSVPSFLQKENDGRDTDSTSEYSYHGSSLMSGRSMTNLSTSSGMTSVSSMSGSVLTMYSGDFAKVEVQGNIQFSINYVQNLREFHIFVAQCHNLAAVDPKRGRSDPYVKSYLVPDKANLGKRKTSVKRKTQNPTFNEILRYRVRLEYLRIQTLILSVWHNDTFGRNSFLGEVDVDLSKWDFDHTQMNYIALKARPTTCLKQSEYRGEMRLAIRFLPQIAHSVAKEGPNTGEVHIWVKDCKNLPLVRGATLDPYVKCFVLPDTSRKSRQKTRVLRRTVEPVFNHTMVYDGFRQEDLKEACVELTVWDRDRLASNLLGGLRLGPGTGRSYGALVDWMDSTPSEVALWERMMESPNEWVEGVLALRMLTTAKTALR